MTLAAANGQNCRTLNTNEGESQEPVSLTDYLWGRSYPLIIIEGDRQSVELTNKGIELCVRPGADAKARILTMDKWYRTQMEVAGQPLIEKWVRLTNVDLLLVLPQRMKSKWGSCNQDGRSIRLNTELARKPVECLEFMLVYQIITLMEPTRKSGFQSLLDQYLPDWKSRADLLNQPPACHDDWDY